MTDGENLVYNIGGRDSPTVSRKLRRTQVYTDKLNDTPQFIIWWRTADWFGPVGTRTKNRFIVQHKRLGQPDPKAVGSLQKDWTSSTFLPTLISLSLELASHNPPSLKHSNPPYWDRGFSTTLVNVDIVVWYCLRFIKLGVLIGKSSSYDKTVIRLAFRNKGVLS